MVDKSLEERLAELELENRKLRQENEDKGRKYDELLVRGKEIINVMFNNTGTAMSIVEPATDISYTNKEFDKITGYSGEELKRKSLLDLIHPLQKEAMLTYHIGLRQNTGKAGSEFSLIDKEGRTKYVHITSTLIPGSKKSIVSLQDITSEKELKEELSLKEQTDRLTGLYNNVCFEKQMPQYQGPIGIVMCDLDGLKNINDMYGYKEGDKVIKRTAEIIRKHSKNEDVPARIGGGEYAVLITGDNEDLVREHCKKLRENIYFSNKDDINVSIGSATGNYSYKVFREAVSNMRKVKTTREYSSQNVAIQALKKAMEERDFYTQDHCDRLNEMCSEFAEYIGLSRNYITDLKLLSQFHDIGKIGIPDNILLKRDKLSAEERREMQRHPEIGYRIASSIPHLEGIASFIRNHHEWWDGRGYPDGIKKKEIPIQSRILSITDAYDAMTSDRPYRKALSKDTALSEIEKYAGIQFDPKLAHNFINYIKIIEG